ncbi:MAG: hypothetical protein V3V08_25390 [Nannocystaceae bacterium]
MTFVTDADEPPTPTSHRPLWRRLRPFLRRDLAARLGSGLVAVAVLLGLGWLGISALTRVDTESARSLRIVLGLENVEAVCGGHDGQPACVYDDLEQATAEQEHREARRIRTAVLRELELRFDDRLARLTLAAETLDAPPTTSDSAKAPEQVADEIRSLLRDPVDLRPAVPEKRARATRRALIRALARPLDRQRYRRQLHEAIDDRRQLLSTHAAHARQLLVRDRAKPTDLATMPRIQAQLQWAHDDTRAPASGLASWLGTAGGTQQVSAALSGLAQASAYPFTVAIANPEAAVWHRGWSDRIARETPIELASMRYHSPVTDAAQWQLLGSALLGLAALILLVVSPVTTAAHTAAERYAGTLPVLRMTGISAGDLAWAMAVGPNVFSLVAGGALLVLGGGVLSITAGPASVALPLVLLAVLTVATHLSAIGLGDALGQRVSPLLVGGLTAIGLTVPGLLGTLFTSLDLVSAGFLLGPLPPVLASITSLTGLQGTSWALNGSHGGIAFATLSYSLLLQVGLGWICLRTWRRRVEKAWAPLFRPAEGIALAIASVGCSVLAFFDLSVRAGASDFEQLNDVAFFSTAFLLPVLVWLLAASLRRPARAKAVPSHVETRRAFLRFQGVLLLSATVVGLAYATVMRRHDLFVHDAEIMWATLAQVLLIAETALGTLLLMSRRKAGKHRVGLFGGCVVLLQTALAIGVYQLESSYALCSLSSTGFGSLAGNTSPYWIAFFAILWGTGLGITLTALLRERDQDAADERSRTESQEYERDDEDDDGMPGRRLVH